MATELKEFRLSTENSNKTPITELYNYGMMSLNFSLTGGSHIWNRTFFPDITKIFSP